MSMCNIFSSVVERRCLLLPVHSLGKILLAFALLHFILQGLSCLLLQVSLDFLLLHSSPLWWKGHLFLVLVLEDLVVSWTDSTSASSALVIGGIDLDYYNIEWFALETNWDQSVDFETVPKYCILDYIVDYEGYSISSKGRNFPTLIS